MRARKLRTQTWSVCEIHEDSSTKRTKLSRKSAFLNVCLLAALKELIQLINTKLHPSRPTMIALRTSFGSFHFSQ